MEGRLLLVGLAFAGSALACGGERWSVKVGTDNDSRKVVLKATPATIARLIRIQPPANPNLREDRRFPSTEITTYRVTAQMTLIRHEADDDYHIVLKDEQGRTMIVESVEPACAVGSRFETAINDARNAIERHFVGPIGQRHPNIMVTVTGVGFFDSLHGQAGGAPNGIELHPLLSITFHGDKSPVGRRLRSGREEEAQLGAPKPEITAPSAAPADTACCG